MTRVVLGAGAMAIDRRNPPEQELSIKEREKELFSQGQDPSSGQAPSKPFSVYLRETPATPMSTPVKVLLWVLGVIVALLFVASLWRSQRSSRSRTEPPPASPEATGQLPAGYSRVVALADLHARD